MRELLQLLSAAAIGVYAGTMLTEAAVLVPAWRDSAPAQFFAHYAANYERLLRFFGAATWAAGLLSLAAAAASLWTRHPGRWAALAAAVLMLACVGSYFVYFQRANQAFAAGTAELPAELDRWAAWHLGRTVVSLLALGAALWAVRKG